MIPAAYGFGTTNLSGFALISRRMCCRRRSAMHRSRACRRRRDFTRVYMAGWYSGFSAARGTPLSASLSAISLLIGSSLGSMVGGDPARFGAMAACTALLTATIAFLAWLAHAGSLVNFVSETVLIGFKVGVALQLASTQLPKLFGVKGGHGNFGNAWTSVTSVRLTQARSCSAARHSECCCSGVCRLGHRVDYKNFWQSKKGFRFALKPVTIWRLASFDRPVFAGATLDQNH